MDRGRTRVVTGAVLLAGAAVTGGAAMTVARDAAGSGELSTSPARAIVVPEAREPPVTSSIQPGSELPTSLPPTSPPATVSSTLPPSPLAALVGAPVSALPVPPAEAPPPIRLFIADLLVDVPIRPVGITPDGQLEVPDETEVGWHRFGAAPGEPGAVVLAAHVSWNRADGPFRDLAGIPLGALVQVDLADGGSRAYQVVERAQYPKAGLPDERIWTLLGPETLVMITCGGAFSTESRRYADNIVVYAVPVS